MKDETQNIFRAVQASALQSEKHLAIHRALVAAAIQGSLSSDVSEPPDNPAREARLRAAIWEAIEILGQSRKAFKSKQMETLRKRLTQVLAEE